MSKATRTKSAKTAPLETTADLAARTAGWDVETLHEEYGQVIRADRVLYESDTEQQRLRVIENARCGRVLLLDGVVQTCEQDEFIYHEMLVHPAILAHGAVRDALIIGGGDGGTLREVRRHAGIARITMVEIDAGVVEFSKKHLPSLSDGAFQDPRLDLVIADGAAFMKDTDRRFDVIIVDSTDPLGPGEALFTAEFYADCRAKLTPGGVLITQSGVPFVQPEELRDAMATLRGLFQDATCYLAAVPTYTGGLMAFGWATDEPAHRRVWEQVLAERAAATDLVTRYYTAAVHKAAFALPPYVAELVEPRD